MHPSQGTTDLSYGTAHAIAYSQPALVTPCSGFYLEPSLFGWQYSYSSSNGSFLLFLTSYPLSNSPFWSCADHQGDWVWLLPWVQYAENSHKHSATGLTPFQCVLGYQLALYPWNAVTTDVAAIDDWFRCSERVWECYQPGDGVWLVTKNIRGMSEAVPQICWAFQNIT